MPLLTELVIPQEIGENIYTLPNVVQEIKDSATRQRLQVLPYKLRLDRTPTSESIHVSEDVVENPVSGPALSFRILSSISRSFRRFQVPLTHQLTLFQAVTEFSKKTGDYPSLSATDLSILGLTHFLEGEVHGNFGHLNTVPKQNAPLINPKRNGDLTLIGGVQVPVVSGRSKLDETPGKLPETWNSIRFLLLYLDVHD